MAENLIKAGHTLVAFNRSKAVVKDLVSQGAVEAQSAREALDRADVLMTCLLLPEQLRAMYFGPDGILESIKSGQIFIDFATVEPNLSREVGEAVTKRGGRFLDAPISGGPKGAAAGTLSIMVGGSDTDFAIVKPVFDVLGKNVFHMGPIGAGTSTKICNQILTGVTHALIGEAMVLGTKLGLDPRALFEVLRKSSGQSNSLERAVPNFILPGKFEPNYTVEGIIKDLECAIRAAKSVGVRFILPNVAQQMYVETASLGFGKSDVASVIRPMEKIAGVEVRDRPR
jgi:3-hydroxyisobutyrate dehydrogenase